MHPNILRREFPIAVTRSFQSSEVRHRVDWKIITDVVYALQMETVSSSETAVTLQIVTASYPTIFGIFNVISCTNITVIQKRNSYEVLYLKWGTRWRSG
jgi:hypothetical protein